MSFGYCGKILRVDLSAMKTRIEEPPEMFYRRYFGGEGFVGYFLLKEIARGVEPLSPENKLIFAAGTLTGVPVGGCGRHSVGSKSPLTGGFGEAESGGFWGAELKMAGLDAIIVEGKADKPVYISVAGGKPEIRDAKHLWGMKTLECQETIRQDLGDSLVKVAQIGPAGERMVRFSCISNDLDAFAGRTGLGAVMGSKNVKAIAVRGDNRLKFADPITVSDIGKWVRVNTPINNAAMHNYGTASVVKPLNASGGLPTRNFQSGSFETADDISGERMSETIVAKRRSCFACAIQCKREVRVTSPFAVDPRYGGPEYETIAAFGSNCGVNDLAIISKCNELVNAYGLDSISTGMAVSFAMECFERGLLTKTDTGGLDLRFGNARAALTLIEEIAERRGLGAILAEGTARAAKKIGPAATEYLITVKGQEMPMHEPRLKQGLGMGYAMSPTGADHCHNMHDTSFTARTPMLAELAPLGIIDPLPLNDLSQAKMRMLTYYTKWMHFLNSAVCCYFVVMYGRVGFERMTKLVNAVTGWDTSLVELMNAGERVMNLARIFNIREGFTEADDTLPQRFFSKHTSGPLQTAVDPAIFQTAKNNYYSLLGWENGIPTKAKLAELGIEWAVDH